MLLTRQSSRGRLQIKARLIFDCSKYLAKDYVYLSIKVYRLLARPINESSIQLGLGTPPAGHVINLKGHKISFYLGFYSEMLHYFNSQENLTYAACDCK